MGGKHRETAGSRTIKASEFKAHCLRLMEEVAESGEDIAITKRGRPVSRLVPWRDPPQKLLGADRDIIRIHGDIVDPLDVEWEAEVDPARVAKSPAHRVVHAADELLA